MRHLLLIILTAAGAACSAPRGGAPPAAAVPTSGMSDIAESYVKLVLALGQHDADYVDAYYGPPEWRKAAEAERAPLAAIGARADSLRWELARRQPPAGAEEMLRLRHDYLTRQLGALAARVRMLGGERLSFDAESKALYGAVAPTLPESHFRATLARLDSLLPGGGDVAERYRRFRSEFVIPRERLDTVFRAAVQACRERTLAHVPLPPGESFTIEYVTGKPWSGYNWYQGNFRSLIQVNTDLPIYVDRALDLACHEGYPGHHVYNALLEQHLMRGRGWVEVSVYPLFSPQSLIAEGSANYGIEVAFPGAERTRLERDVIFPLAGLDPARAERYYAVQALVRDLGYAGNEAARRYLNGEIGADPAADWLVRYALMTPEQARQRVRFFDKYRSYVINYNLGQDLVKQYVESRAGEGATPGARWRAFVELLSSPRLLSSGG